MTVAFPRYRFCLEHLETVDRFGGHSAAWMHEQNSAHRPSEQVTSEVTYVFAHVDLPMYILCVYRLRSMTIGIPILHS